MQNVVERHKQLDALHWLRKGKACSLQRAVSAKLAQLPSELALHQSINQHKSISNMMNE